MYRGVCARAPVLIYSLVRRWNLQFNTGLKRLEGEGYYLGRDTLAGLLLPCQRRVSI